MSQGCIISCALCRIQHISGAKWALLGHLQLRIDGRQGGEV